MSKRPLDPSSDTPSSKRLALDPTAPPPWCKSSPIYDRESIFTARFLPASHPLCTSRSPTQLVQLIREHISVEVADHHIAAWRLPPQSNALTRSLGGVRKDGAVVMGHDDDGEKYAGVKLGKVLLEMGVRGVVVVSRIYGGIMLGPVRFEHIENCAREAIRLSLAPKIPTTIPTAAAMEEDEDALRKVLVGKDRTIAFLRTTIAELRSQSCPSPQPPSSQQDGARYAKLPLDRLERLVKARDAGIESLRRMIAEEEEKRRVEEEAWVEVAKAAIAGGKGEGDGEQGDGEQGDGGSKDDVRGDIAKSEPEPEPIQEPEEVELEGQGERVGEDKGGEQMASNEEE
ncbi:hypothetical protein SAICODRAFT_23171 [Saitoella complicata NRRL Y-17804]|uniref:Impact N-terminal domain-containing protein n=1 Tax=Saitoella complicata (strain BCRC 22490 / CBS 7301 / JCM 7358 / NBRC 10748 / NRRL Y-17804) TaxID=698492 RepID=A0A0E9NAA2_SAICN|nr:uncharacterized protein SAICODRAFT_23171 [Saitoella complicata NRRL Y-17804]ODQ55816.1 hypothetical protein SAICODRAFT_23171 [Saitoella complicata NRRL Y-17804]GAO46728.1 hypothetical protein G7K_0950-t1 [Saitoella complicata NRRL Y-17804]